jgi:hypothetical protein
VLCTGMRESADVRASNWRIAVRFVMYSVGGETALGCEPRLALSRQDTAAFGAIPTAARQRRRN